MKRVLIVQSDAQKARDLSTTIAAQGDANISHASTVREACLLIAEKPYDLVLVDDREEDGARRALHALQPDLMLKALSLGDLAAENGARLEELFRFLFDEPDEVSGGQTSVEPSGFEERGAADWIENAVERRQPPSQDETLVDLAPLPSVEATLLDAKLETTPESVTQTEDDGSQNRLSRLLAEMPATDKVAGCTLSTSEGLVEVGGALTAEQAQVIAKRVADTWPAQGSALMQFIEVGEPAVEVMLFTREAAPAHYLTLVAAPDVDAGRLRRAAETLLAALVVTSGSAPETDTVAEAPPVATYTSKAYSDAPRSFAMIIQPRRPLPPALQGAVRDALLEVAADCGCRLSHESVTADLVHLVSTCPPDRGSGWLAQQYKAGVEQRIQERYGVPAQLWRKGFYAQESDQPLSDVELKLFLHQ